MNEATGKADLRDASRGERLQKILAQAGVGSRRRCEELIESGVVRVNGEVVTQLPVWVNPAVDEIFVEKRRITKAERHVYVLVYKPRRYMTTLDDPEGRKTVAELVKHPSGARLFPVGRLDYETLGLLLMTNDGELANKLTHPRHGIRKTYRAVIKGRLAPEDVGKLGKGVFLTDQRDGELGGGARRAGAVAVRIVKRDRERTIIDITLAEGRNRQIRRMLAGIGHPVRKLTRFTMGPLRLKGLAVGEWRELTRDELGALRRAARGEAASRGEKRVGSRSGGPER